MAIIYYEYIGNIMFCRAGDLLSHNLIFDRDISSFPMEKNIDVISFLNVSVFSNRYVNLTFFYENCSNLTP